MGICLGVDTVNTTSNQNQNKQEEKRDNYIYEGTNMKSTGSDFHIIKDKFETVEQVQDELRKRGLEVCDLVIGIDYTASNTWNGKNSFGGNCLHHMDPNYLNPYQHIIQTIGRTLRAFDNDGEIPTYGFGDSVTRGTGVFPLNPNGICSSFEDVVDKYNQMTPRIQLGGPTNFGPVIRKCIEHVKIEQNFHILIIIADGEIQDGCKKDTENAIVEASQYPISIVVIGVGDGGSDNFETMKNFDDGIPKRKFDNFQFVHYEDLKKMSPQYFDARFALCTLMESAEQYRIMKKRGLVNC